MFCWMLCHRMPKVFAPVPEGAFGDHVMPGQHDGDGLSRFAFRQSPCAPPPCGWTLRCTAVHCKASSRQPALFLLKSVYHETAALSAQKSRTCWRVQPVPYAGGIRRSLRSLGLAGLPALRVGRPPILKPGMGGGTPGAGDPVLGLRRLKLAGASQSGQRPAMVTFSSARRQLTSWSNIASIEVLT